MIVLDATVAVKLVTAEPGSEAARIRVAHEPDRIAPDWIAIELANVLSRKVRRDGLPEAAARAARDAIDLFVTEQVSALDLIDEAFDLSPRIDHAAYDCLYLALALRHGAVVVTHDAKFAAAARRGGFADHVELLA